MRRGESWHLVRYPFLTFRDQFVVRRFAPLGFVRDDRSRISTEDAARVAGGPDPRATRWPPPTQVRDDIPPA